MARELRWWIAGTLLACAGLASVYTPPRGANWPGAHRAEPEPPSPFRFRERYLAHKLREVETEVRLLEYRDRLRPEFDRRLAAGIPAPASLIVGLDPLPESTRRLVAREVDAAWRSLGLGVTKVSVGVVLELPPGTQQARWMLYLLPDSSDRTSCIALLPATYWRRSLTSDSLPNDLRFRTWLQRGLGPCAFFAAFGNPGRGVARWLSQRHYDLALDPAWATVNDLGAGPWWMFPGPNRPVDFESLFWTMAHHLPANAVGCLAGRAPSCQVAVLGITPLTDTVRRFVANDLWMRNPSLLGDDHYLADVYRAIGQERFREFWNSEMPVDTALAAALRAPVGDWTLRWERRSAPRVRLGPAAPLPSVLLGLLLAAVAVGSVARLVYGREVR
jgi:hypothetical protein